ARKRLQILLRRLGRAIVAQGKSTVKELVSSACADVEQLRAGKFLESIARFCKPLQIFADDSTVDLAQNCFDLAGAMVLYLAFIEAFVGSTAAKCGNVWNCAHLDGQD